MSHILSVRPGDDVTWSVFGSFEHLRYRRPGVVLAVGSRLDLDTGRVEHGAMVAWGATYESEPFVAFAPFWNQRFQPSRDTGRVAMVVP